MNIINLHLNITAIQVEKKSLKWTLCKWAKFNLIGNKILAVAEKCTQIDT